MSRTPTPKRGEIWLVKFDPSVGAEIRKLRPADVLSIDSIGRLPLRVVVPITEWKADYGACSWFVSISASPSNGLSKASGADTFQVKSISNDRFVKELGDLSPAELDEIATAIAMVVGK